MSEKLMGIGGKETIWPVIKPNQEPKKNFRLSDDFWERVMLHIVKNDIVELNAPLFLAIQGPKGEGKSTQAREACARLGVHVVPISGSSLSGNFEKDAVNIIADAYIYASNYSKHKKVLVALIIDDFDLSVASKFNDTYNTVNTQLLCGFLMNLADNPTICEKEETLRIPIIMTGNNFASLYGPLTRHGRMDFFNWIPDFEQKYQIVCDIFREWVNERDQNRFKNLIKKYSGEPISFFSTLKIDYVDMIIANTYRQKGNIDTAHVRDSIRNVRDIELGILENLAQKRKLAKPINLAN